MRLKWTVNVFACLALSPMLFLLGCQDNITHEILPGAHRVGICAGTGATRTEILPDGLSAAWVNGDAIALWAKASSGSYILSNQQFNIYGTDAGSGYFTSTLASPMPEDTYTYYSCYPVPASVNGTDVTFTLPAVQDGKVSSGADIMIATPVEHGPLTAIGEQYDHSYMSMKMNKMLHHLRLYVPDTDIVLGNETIEKIVVTFPRNVVGNITYNLEDVSQAPVLTDASAEITLKLSENLGISTSDAMSYACLAMAPTAFSSGESMRIRAYTASYILNMDKVNLRSRSFEAGHSTPVAMRFLGKDEYCRVRFTVTGNNLGENAKSVILKAPSGCKWGETGTDTYTYTPGHEITTGETFDIVFEDVPAYRAFSGKDITVSFDTEHVLTSQVITLPNMMTGHMTEVKAALPYLLYEDFSSVPSFSSSDNYAMSSSEINNVYSFMNGWSGGRIGGEAGKCIRIACRRETSANYPARADSAPIIALKKTANISVTFDYGMNNQYGGIYITPPDYGQTYHVGYVTSSSAYGSGDDTGVFESANSKFVHEKGGSYDSTPNNETYILHNVPAGLVRITWRTTPQSKAGMDNTTCWLYIDNVKVQIAR